jgi:hypothetical protein
LRRTLATEPIFPGAEGSTNITRIRSAGFSVSGFSVSVTTSVLYLAISKS